MKKANIVSAKWVGAGLLGLALTGPVSAQIIGSPTDTGGAAKAGVGNDVTNHAAGIPGSQPGQKGDDSLPQDGDGSLQQAYKDYTDKKYPQAAAELQTIVKKAPNSLEAHEMLADIYLKQNKVADAVPQLESIVRLQPKDTATRDNLGIAYLQVGSYDKAATLYQTALTQSPKDPKLAFQYAISLEKSGKHAEAAAAFEKAAALDPKDSRAPLYAGLLYHQTGNDTKAVPALQSALALGTDQKYNAYTALAEAASNAKQTDEAVQNYTLAAQAKPDDFGTYANLGVVNQNAGRKAAAEAAYQKAITLKADDPKSLADVQSNYSLLLIEDGKLDDAAALLTQAATGDPTNPRIQDNLGQVYEKQGKKADALAAYKKALTLDPTLAAAKEGVARLSK